MAVLFCELNSKLDEFTPFGVGDNVETLSKVASYTAKKDCYVQAEGITTVALNVYHSLTISLDNGLTARANSWAEGDGLFVYLPVRKGQTVTCSAANMQSYGITKVYTH